MARPAVHVPRADLMDVSDDTEDLIWSDLPWPVLAGTSADAQVEYGACSGTPEESPGKRRTSLHILHVSPTGKRD